MKRGAASARYVSVVLGVVACFCFWPEITHAQDVQAPGVQSTSGVMQVFDKNGPQLVSYIPGYDRGPLVAIEEAIRNAPPDQYKVIESWFLTCIRIPQATADCKQFICRMLQRVGSADAAPVVAPLLLDEHLSQMALYALAHVSDDAVDEVLRTALSQASGAVKLGMIHALGERRKAGNASVLMGLFEDPDKAVCTAAVAALGQCGEDKAIESCGGRTIIEVLANARQSANPVLREAATRAYLDCADRLFRQGRNDVAARMFDEVFAGDAPKAVHVAAFRGRVAARGESGIDLLLEGLKGSAPELWIAALQFAREIPGSKATAEFVALLPSLAGEQKALLLGALADRGDKTALPGVLAATKDGDAAIRAAAFDALAALGDASTALALANTAARGQGEDGEGPEAARKCLARISGTDVDEALLREVDTPVQSLKIELVRIFVARKTIAAAPALLNLTHDADALVRSEALKALAALGRDEDLQPLLDLMINAAGDSESEAAASALISTANRAVGNPQRTSILLTALAKARGAQVKSNIVSALGSAGDETALESVHAAVQHEAPEVQDAAVRALSAWLLPQALPILLNLAKAAPRESHRILALRGYVRLLGEVRDWPPEKMLDAYKTALEVAQRAEDKKQVLGGLATLAAPEALAVVELYLNNPELASEAVAAVLKIAMAIAPTHPDQAKAALQRIAALPTDELTQDTVKAFLDKLRATHS